jgi:type IV secretion system protein VirD4
MPGPIKRIQEALARRRERDAMLAKPYVVIGEKGGVLLKDRTRRPILVTGPTECGKTSSVAYPTAFEYSHSMVFWSLKGTEVEDVGKARERFGDVIVLDIAEPGGACVNVLQWVRKDRLVADCQYVARKLVENEKDGVWKNAAFSYLTGVLVYLLTAAPDADKNLAGVRRHCLAHDEGLRLMNRDGVHETARDAARELWDRSMKTAEQEIREIDEENEHIERTGKAPEKDDREDRILDRSSGIRKSVYFTCSVLLADFERPEVRESTSRNDFFPSDLMCGERPVSLFLIARPMDSETMPHVYKLILSMIVDHLSHFRDRAADGRPKNWDLLLNIDEFLMLHFQSVKHWVKFVREAGVRLMLLGQSYWEVEDEYGKGLTANTRWLDFQPLNMTEAEFIQKSLGDSIEEVETRSVSRRGLLSVPTVSSGTRVDRRPVFQARDAIEMDGTWYWAFGWGRAIRVERLYPWRDGRWKHLYGRSEGTWVAPDGRNPWDGHLVPVPEKPRRLKAPAGPDAAPDTFRPGDPTRPRGGRGSGKRAREALPPPPDWAEDVAV